MELTWLATRATWASDSDHPKAPRSPIVLLDLRHEHTHTVWPQRHGHSAFGHSLSSHVAGHGTPEPAPTYTSLLCGGGLSGVLVSFALLATPIQLPVAARTTKYRICIPRRPAPCPPSPPAERPRPTTEEPACFGRSCPHVPSPLP